MSQLVSRAFKYILMFIISYILIKYVPNLVIDDKYILIISFLISISYAVMERISPST